MGTVCLLCKGKVVIGLLLSPLCCALILPLGLATRTGTELLGFFPTLYQSRVDGTTDDAHGNEQFTCFCSSKTDIRAGQDSGQQGNVTAGENVSPALEQYSAVQWCKPDQQSDGANDWKSESNASSECEHVSDFWNSHDKAKWTR